MIFVKAVNSIVKITKKKLKNICKEFKKIIKKYNYIFLLAIPFILMDLSTRYFGSKINFFQIYKLVPNLFTLIWIFFFLGTCLSLKKSYGKILYIFIFVISFIVFLVNNVYYSMTHSFFDFSLILMASEGSSYIIDTVLNCNIWVYIVSLFIIIITIVVIRKYPKVNVTNKKNIIKVFLIFLGVHSLIPLLLGRANDELTWSTWRNPRNIYINFNDNNKSMTISGLYEYTFRNFYITFIKAKKTNNEEEIQFLEEVYNNEEENYTNKYTGKFKDKNLIIIQLEGIDNWLLTKETTPTLYSLMTESINFTNHYSYYNGGGSTFNSEFAVNTGFITPLSYTQNAYTFNKNEFTYSMARLFKNNDYSVNAFHMNTSEYYSRGTNYETWGYDNYYGLKDLGNYNDETYTLDRELILNEAFSEKMFSEEKFLDYIITYSSHMPFTTEKGVCQMLVKEDLKKELEVEEIPSDTILPFLSEEQCAKRQAKETDYMVELLLNKLREKSLIDNTIIVVFTDHYLYTLSDETILGKYKETNNNLINKTPFFIWSADSKENRKITEVTSQLNILPTILNLFGLEYHPNYYIEQDALDPDYDGHVFFSDYSWYDGNVYVDGGFVINNTYIDPLVLEDKNYYINYLIRKNDLTLKYNYFKTIKSKNNKKV